MNPNGSNNLGRESPNKHFCQIIWKSVQWFLTRKFLQFSIWIYRETWRPCFMTNPNGLNNLGRGSSKEHFCNIILKSVQWFRTRRFFKFLVKKSIFSSCDLDMQWLNHLNNFERGPTKDHSCEVWSNSNQWFRRRCCLKIVDGRTYGR